ncbi:hypothetical protein N7493_009884 [Penicillium malachiteum]|uniref:Ankyrin n=1 Tax=Penicillium malachiteum TaxID=1324776 RepID=A0AAD6HDP1_9EURO|nr:hypothetical protein N7493_009884 [Penicillium malachiteum]
MSLDKIHPDIALCIADLLDEDKDLVAFLKTTRSLYPALAHYTAWRYREIIFQYAVKHSRPDLLKLVIHMPLDVNRKLYPDFRTPICFALMNGDKKSVELLLTKPDLKLNRSEAAMRGSTPLQYVIKAGNETIMESLLSHEGMDVYTASAALWTAFGTQSLNAMKLLLKHNVEPDSPRGRKFLLGAVWSAGQLPFFDVLIEDERVDLGYYWRSEFSGQDPIFLGWMKDLSMERLTRLWHHRSRITASAEVDLPGHPSLYIPNDSLGNNALHIAVARGHHAWAEYLFEQFPDMAHQYNDEYDTPISMVIAKKDLVICDFLLRTNPSIFLMPNHLSDPPVFEIIHKKDLSLFKRVHSVLGDSIFTLRDLSGDVPIIEAATQGYNAMVKGLIRLGADPNATNRDGCTPLMLAARNNNLSLVNSLLRFRTRVDVDREDQLGWTAYIWARWPQYRPRGQTSKDHAEIRRVLEARGAGKGALDRVEKKRWPKKMWLSSSIRKSLV